MIISAISSFVTPLSEGRIEPPARLLDREASLAGLSQAAATEGPALQLPFAGEPVGHREMQRFGLAMRRGCSIGLVAKTAHVHALATEVVGRRGRLWQRCAVCSQQSAVSSYRVSARDGQHFHRLALARRDTHRNMRGHHIGLRVASLYLVQGKQGHGDGEAADAMR